MTGIASPSAGHGQGSSLEIELHTNLERMLTVVAGRAGMGLCALGSSRQLQEPVSR